MKVFDLQHFYCMQCNLFVITCPCSDQINKNLLNVAIELINELKLNGFLLIMDCKLEISTNSMVQISQQFFRNSDSFKLQAVSKDRARRGYSPAMSENFATLNSIKGQPNDSVEKFRIGPFIIQHELSVNQSYYNKKEARISFFPNNFPSIENFEMFSKQYYNQMSRLSKLLLNVILFALNIPCSSFEHKFDKETSILSLNYYPNKTYYSTYENDIRIAEHTDISVFTIVSQHILATQTEFDCKANDAKNNNTEKWVETSEDDKVVLEVFNNNLNDWEIVPYIPNTFLVNVGDCFNQWSNGLFTSAKHRVIKKKNNVIKKEKNDLKNDVENIDDTILYNKENTNNNDYNNTERYSLAFFFAPNYDAILDWPIHENEENFNLFNNELSLNKKNEDNKLTEIKDFSEILSYSEWRKRRIKQAMKFN